MLQIVSPASQNTIEKILEILPQPASIIVEVACSFSTGLGTRVNQILTEETKYDIDLLREQFAFSLKSPNKGNIVKLISDKKNKQSVPIWFKEASFYPKMENGGGYPCNVKLTQYELTIDYWNNEITPLVTALLLSASAFNDIKITVNKHKS